jgi:hypothetical protein
VSESENHNSSSPHTQLTSLSTSIVVSCQFFRHLTSNRDDCPQPFNSDLPLSHQLEHYPTPLAASPADTGSMNRVPLIPGLTRGLASKAWEQVIKDWEEADPDRSLYIAMKDGEPQWHKSSNLTQKYGQRKAVALEFIDL